MNEFLLEAFPNPERKDCPDEGALKAFAEGRIPSTDKIGLHVGSCSECYAEYRHYRLDWNESILKTGPVLAASSRSATPRSAWQRYALVASLLIICGLVTSYFIHHARLSHVDQVASTEPVNAAVDLFDVPTLRSANDDGGAGPSRQINLPASIVHVAITLPRFSQGGPYDVVVSADRNGHQLIAKNSGTASESNGKVLLQVTLDLRSAKGGSYFLATVRHSDNGTYYYPLKIN
jgi:hypothetical protein